MRERGTKKGESQRQFPSFHHHCVGAVEGNLGLLVLYTNASGALIKWGLAALGMRFRGMYLTQEEVG